jgi:hypothetical protein
MLYDEINKNKNWHFYGLDFGDEQEEFTSHCLIAVNKSIGNDRELLEYWSQIEPNLFFVWGHVIDWTEYNIDLGDDDAELATYIELMEV